MDEPSDLIAKRTVLARLSAELTEELSERLAGYCAVKASRRSWCGLKPGSPIVGGHTPEDIVQIVILKTIRGVEEGPGRGRRLWNGERDLFDHLTSQIDSEISNLVRSWANRKVQRSSQTAERRGTSEEAFLEAIVGEDDDSPELLALREEEERIADEFVSGFLDFLGSDEDLLLAVVGEILDGARKPSEIAEALALAPQQVYSARKRLQRRLEAYCDRRGEKGVD